MDHSVHVVALGLVNLPSKRVPSYQWREKFLDQLQYELASASTGLVVDRSLSELGEMIDIRSWYVHRATVEFAKGAPARIVNKSEVDSWFGSEIMSRMNFPEQES